MNRDRRSEVFTRKVPAESLRVTETVVGKELLFPDRGRQKLVLVQAASSGVGTA
jgi:hypothetical protein